jgi:hypothetical protein
MYCYIRCCFALHHKMLHTLLHTSVLNTCRSTTKTHSMTEALYEANRKGCTMSCSRTITHTLLHKLVHPLFSRGASSNVPYLAVSLCIRTYETFCVLVRVAKPNDKVWNRLWCHAEQQRTDHSVSSHKQQWMDHFMKHNE